MEIHELCEALGLDRQEFAEYAWLFAEVASQDMGRMEKALGEGSLASVAEAAHSIKGAAATLDLEEIFSIARHIEMKARSGCAENLEEDLERLREQVHALECALKEERGIGVGMEPLGGL